MRHNPDILHFRISGTYARLPLIGRTVLSHPDTAAHAGIPAGRRGYLTTTAVQNHAAVHHIIAARCLCIVLCRHRIVAPSYGTVMYYSMTRFSCAYV